MGVVEAAEGHGLDVVHHVGQLLRDFLEIKEKCEHAIMVAAKIDQC